MHSKINVRRKLDCIRSDILADSRIIEILGDSEDFLT